MTDSKVSGQCSDGEIEPIYIELAKQVELADDYYVPRIIKKLANLEEARIIRELPASPDVIGEKLNLDVEKVKTVLKSLIKKGCIVRTERGLKLFGNSAQLGDFGCANPAYDQEKGDDFYDMVAAWGNSKSLHKASIEGMLAGVTDGAPVARVLPRWRAIKDIPGVMPSEDVRELLKRYDGKLSTTRCFCRTLNNSRHCAVNEGTHPDEGSCIHFDKVAKYYVNELELGKYRTWEEILKNLDELDKSPTYQMVGNSKDVRFICNCCTCCCGVARPFNESKNHTIKEFLAPSRFLCTINQEKCEACGICMGKCPFGAIEKSTDGEHMEIKGKVCMGCGVCVLNCPNKALKLKLIRPPEYIPDLCIQWVDAALLEHEEPIYS